jgi:hypothetical protein
MNEYKQTNVKFVPFVRNKISQRDKKVTGMMANKNRTNLHSASCQDFKFALARN